MFVATWSSAVQALQSALAALPHHVPFYLFGESMGGAVAILAAHSGRVVVDGVLLRAPMCGIDESLVPPACVVSTLACIARCFPTAAIVPGYV